MIQNNQSQTAIPSTKTRRVGQAFLALVLFAISFAGGWLGGQSSTRHSDPSASRQQIVLSKQADIVSSIANQVGESVVSVNVTTTTAQTDPYALLFGMGPRSTEQKSAGTGVVLNAKGLVLTNRHVVPQGISAVSITLSDGTVLDKVRVLGRTSERDSLDVAFLQIEDTKGKKLVPAKLGDSAAMQVGDSVVAIGNALGQFQNTVTTGIISGYGRSVEAGDGASYESLDDLFQTDAAINQGNSGGPLVNMNGEVIGINTAVASNSENIGFAIPINNIKGLIESVTQTGKLERPYLGVMYVLLTDDIAKRYDLAVTRGAYIPKPSEGQSSSVLEGGPAAKAGVQPGDVIVKVDGTAINEKHSLVSLLSTKKAGQKVQLSVTREGKTLTLTATLEAAPAN
jgi:serine protease Do